MKHGAKSLMVWGAIKIGGSWTIIRCPNILNSMEFQNVLRSGLLPFYDSRNIFQQDGAPCHTVASTIAFLEDHGVCLLSDMPAQSPDINIIECLWSELKSEVARKKSTSIDDLWTTCKEAWVAIPTVSIKTIYQSITRWLKEVIQKKGSNTSY